MGEFRFMLWCEKCGRPRERIAALPKVRPVFYCAACYTLTGEKVPMVMWGGGEVSARWSDKD